jgi:aminopeptidase N
MSLNNSIAIVLGCMLLSLSACKVSKSNTAKTPAAVAEAKIVIPDTTIKMYRASATKYWELVHTDIDIHFNLPERTADAIEKVSMHPYFYDTDSILLDAKSMIIKEVIDNQNQPLSFTNDSLKLHIHLPKTYHQTDTLQLTIKYTALPYSGKLGGSSAIREDRGLYFINTNHEEPYLPVQIWTQGETESNSHWFPTFDNPIFKSTFTITLHVPDSFQTLSNGTMIKSTPESNHYHADTWYQSKPIATYLAMMAAGNYAISKETWRGKEVNYYVPQQYAAYGKDIFHLTPEMIEFFSNKLNVPYPWDKYSQVVGYQYVSGAMENVSASLFGAFNLKDKRQLADDNNDFIIAHELFHQWFGDLVTAESWSNLTLNESFADYSEQLWTNYKYGDDARGAYWLQDITKYLNAAKFHDPPLLRFYYNSQEDLFDRISYSKGGVTLHYLHSLMGDKAFFDGLHLYLTQNAYGNGEVAQLRIAFEKVTGKDWNWFFNQWYLKGGHPQLGVDYNYDDTHKKLQVIITQQQPDSVGLYELPMKTLIISGDKTKEVWWTVKHAKDTFIIDYENGQKPVVVPDVAHWVVGDWKDNKAPWQWYAQYKSATDHVSKRFALTGLSSSYKTNDTCQLVYLMALKDKDPAIRTFAMTLYTYDKSPKVTREWKAQLGKIAAQDSDNKTRAKALHALGDLGEAEFTSTYETAINDSSYKVAAEGLYALNRVNHKRAVEYARELHPENSMGNVLLYQCAQVIGSDGETNDLHFFTDKTLHLFENERKLFLNAFQNYLVHAKDDKTYEAGIDFMKEHALQYANSLEGIYYGGLIKNLIDNAEAEQKTAVDKSKWAIRITHAQNAFATYKNAVTDEDVKEALNDLGKNK